MIWLTLLPWLALTGHTVVNAALLRRPPRAAITTKRVAVLLPLRDEAERVAPCLAALLAQRGVPHLTIHVLDDGSTDGTADVVAAAGLKAVTGAPLPPGWLGKPHACQQLADAAQDAEVLVFLDADVVLEPDAVAGAVVAAGAVVSRDVPARTLVAGVPAQVVKPVDEPVDESVD